MVLLRATERITLAAVCSRAIWAKPWASPARERSPSPAARTSYSTIPTASLRIERRRDESNGGIGIGTYNLTGGLCPHERVRGQRRHRDLPQSGGTNNRQQLEHCWRRRRTITRASNTGTYNLSAGLLSAAGEGVNQNGSFRAKRRNQFRHVGFHELVERFLCLRRRYLALGSGLLSCSGTEFRIRQHLLQRLWRPSLSPAAPTSWACCASPTTRNLPASIISTAAC